MKYLDDKFSVHPGASKKYRDNFDEVFAKKKDKPQYVPPDDMPTIPEPIDMKPEPVEQKKHKKVVKKKTNRSK